MSDSVCLVLYLTTCVCRFFFFFSSRRRHTRFDCDWSSDVCSSDLLVNFSDIATTVDSATAYTDFFDTSTGRSLNGYWQEASYGQSSAVGNVFGPFTVGPSTSYSCSTIFNQLANDALAAAIAGGVNLQNYSRVFIVI